MTLTHPLTTRFFAHLPRQHAPIVGLVAHPAVFPKSGTAGHRQQGVALVISLIFLVLLTLLAITSVSTTTLQGKMAGNLKDQDMSLQSAEAAARLSEWALAKAGLPGKPKPNNAAGYIWDVGFITNANFNDDTWWKANGTLYDAASISANGSIALPSVALPDVAEQPRFVIEKLQERQFDLVKGQHYPDDVSKIYFYRLSARGVGQTDKATTVLQTVVGVKY